MKLVIEVNEEDYKRYKDDKVCSYASAVLDAVPLSEVLDEIKEQIEKYQTDILKIGRIANINEDCKNCNKTVFDSFYRLIDKYREE